jgi:DNA mismatch endonuclease, patch repair protein
MRKIGKIELADYKQRDPAVTSRIMSSIRSNGNQVETGLRRALHARGLRFRKNLVSLPGKPDIVFLRERVVIFVDGDYWHGRKYLQRGLPALRAMFSTPNKEYWINKIRRNVQRDRAVNRRLARLGWHVVRRWESDLRHDVNRGADEIMEIVLGRRSRIQSKS